MNIMRKSERIKEHLLRKQNKFTNKMDGVNLRSRKNMDRDLQNLTKEVLLILLVNRRKWISLEGILDHFPKSSDLVIQIVFVFKGIGLIQMISFSRILFLGIKGSLQLFLDFTVQKLENCFKNQNQNKSEYIK